MEKVKIINNNGRIAIQTLLKLGQKATTIQEIETLTKCLKQLKEKYLRGQKDFTKEIWDKLEEFYKKEIKKNGNNKRNKND